MEQGGNFYVDLFCVRGYMQWTPEGRRLVTGASSGEFTLWNGLTFNFETILQVNTHVAARRMARLQLTPPKLKYHLSCRFIAGRGFL